MDVMRKSKFLLQEVRESMLQGLNMKAARMLYLFMFWRGGGIGSESPFVWNFFINHILQSPFVHLQSPFMVFEWKYIIVLCLIIPPPFLTNLIRTAHTCVVHDNQREIYGRGNHGCSDNKG